MPWEYLDKLNYRYELASGLVDFKDKHVVDLCSGNTGLYNFVHPIVASYRACDIRPLSAVAEPISDDKFVRTVEHCDILCLFGYGGYEITKEPLESSTVLDSMKYLIDKFDPVIVLECVSKFVPALQEIIQPYQRQEIRTAGDDWLTDRVMFILRR